MRASYRSVLVFLVIIFGACAYGFAAEEEGEGEAHRGKKDISLADVGKLKCEELQPLGESLRRQYRSIREISKRAQNREFGNRKQLEEIKHELENGTFEAAKSLIGKLKTIKEGGEAATAISEALKLEAAIEAAEEGAKRLKLLKGLHKLAKVTAIATNPYIVIAVFAVDMGIEVYEALERAENARDWTKESEALSRKLANQEGEVGNKLAAVLTHLESKKCPAKKLNAGSCFGRACGRAVIAEEDHSDSQSFFYTHLCRQFHDLPSFSTTLSFQCKDEVANMIKNIGYEKDPKGYPQFEVTRKLIRANERAIRQRCEYEACQVCVGRNADDLREPPKGFGAPVGSFEHPFTSQIREDASKRSRKSGMKVCEENFGPNAKRSSAGVAPYHGPKVDYSNHDSKGRQIWPSGPRYRYDPRIGHMVPDRSTHDPAAAKREAEEAARQKAARERDARLAQDPQHLKGIAPPFKAPKGQKISCECFARCTSEATRLGYPSYLFTSNAMAVRDCEKGIPSFENLTGQKFCKSGETTLPGACQWRLSDEGKPTVRSFKKPVSPLDKKGSPNYTAKCQWDKGGDEPVPLKSDEQIATRINTDTLYGSRPDINKVLRVMAACRAQGTKVSFCFQISNQWYVAKKGAEGKRGGWRNECWNTEGKVELRSEFNGRFTEPDETEILARADREHNFFEGLGDAVADAGKKKTTH